MTIAVESAGALGIDVADVSAVLERLFTPAAVRERALAIFDLAARGGTHFALHRERLDDVADYTIGVMRENYPDLRIPYHSRHGHLRAGGVDRPAELAARARAAGADEILRSTIDLVVVSVLLDAGAGDGWRYEETRTGRTYTRSEGLAVASFDMFMAGMFSGDRDTPMRADVAGLRALGIADLERGFRVSGANPLTGIEGRAKLVNGLAASMSREPAIFPRGRISDLLDQVAGDGEVRAARILDFVLRYFGDIWPGGLSVGGRNLGDVWVYPPFGDGAESLIPFHKLSQWLTYSLLVPLIEHGYSVCGTEELTGLAEYRNGGLMLDSGLLELRAPALQGGMHSPGSELIVEWRALTVVLLDLIAERVRRRLGKSPLELPLAAVLEGGTWHAGRKIARQKRPHGEPPLHVISDGTVF